MIRKADINDLPRLAELFSELHEFHCRIFTEAHIMPEPEYFRSRMSEILSDGEQTVLLSESGDIDGYALFKLTDTGSEMKPPEKVCFIDCFAVTEKRRGQGVGTALFEAVCAFARENGCGAIRLGVTANNDRALRFYEKMGLAPRTIIMSKKIS